jgi:hypothetical protein
MENNFVLLIENNDFIGAHESLNKLAYSKLGVLIEEKRKMVAANYDGKVPSDDKEDEPDTKATKRKLLKEKLSKGKK